jgi:hypothetical protein
VSGMEKDWYNIFAENIIKIKEKVAAEIPIRK